MSSAEVTGSVTILVVLLALGGAYRWLGRRALAGRVALNFVELTSENTTAESWHHAHQLVGASLARTGTILAVLVLPCALICWTVGPAAGTVATCVVLLVGAFAPFLAMFGAYRQLRAANSPGLTT